MKRIIKDLKKLNEFIENTDYDTEEALNEDIQALKEVLYKHKDLVALAGPQIGIKHRLFCIKFNNGDIRTFINPMIVHRKGTHLSRETNISIKNKEYIIPRSDEIQAKYYTPSGHQEVNLFQGAVSEVFQQMNDLLDGIMLSDLGLELVDEWDSASQEERDQVIDMYLKSLEEKKTSLQKEISEDKEMNEMSKAIDFMTSVYEGKTKIELDAKSSFNRAQRRAVIKMSNKSKKHKR